MAEQDNTSKQVYLAYTVMGVLSAIGLVVLLNGGQVIVTIILLLGAAASGGYIVRMAIKRFR
jgi:hypothetical protein